MTDRARQMLQFPGVVKKSAAQAMGVSSFAISRMLKGERGISADEFAKLETYYRIFRGEGLEEAPAPELNPTPKPSLVFPARAFAAGDWAVDLAADPIQRSLAPPPFQGMSEVYGFHAPDSAAWPRFKAGETVWVSPADLVLAGDDAFFVRSGGAGAHRGFVGELAAPIGAGLRYRDFSTGAIREINDFAGSILKLAPRDA